MTLNSCKDLLTSVNSPICRKDGPRQAVASRSWVVPKIRLAKRTIHLPENRAVRLGLGGALVVGGLFGFLPILGFWMIPLGFLVLAQDIPAVRRFNRRVSVKAKRWWTGAKSARERSRSNSRMESAS